MKFEKYICELCDCEFVSWPGWPAICFDCRQRVLLRFPPSRANRKTMRKIGYWSGLSRWIEPLSEERVHDKRALERLRKDRVKLFKPTEG